MRRNPFQPALRIQASQFSNFFTMSGPAEITIKQEVAFIKRMLIPSFDADRHLTTTLARKEWMSNRAKEKNWDPVLAAELIDMYGLVDSLNKAEEKLKENLLLMQQEGETDSAVMDGPYLSTASLIVTLCSLSLNAANPDVSSADNNIIAT
jgi:hypothetical protein